MMSPLSVTADQFPLCLLIYSFGVIQGHLALIFSYNIGNFSWKKFLNLPHSGLRGCEENLKIGKYSCTLESLIWHSLVLLNIKQNIVNNI